MSTERTESPSYQLFMLALSVLALIALAVDVTVHIDPESELILQYADTTVCAVFFFDFLRCLWRAENRWRYLYTWGWADLAASIPTLDVARWGRLARVARILRVLRGLRAMRIVADTVINRRRESAFLTATLAVLVLLVTASLLILRFEVAPGSNIRTAEEAMWWTITTVTTVGYGDRYPVTSEGRLVAAVLMSAGIGLFGMLSGLLASWFVGSAGGGEPGEITALRADVQRVQEALDRLSAATPRT